MKILSTYHIKDSKGRWRKIAKCKCDYCNRIFETRHDYTKEKRAKSCGCQRGNKKHGYSHSLTYSSWRAMKKRTLNSNHHAYYKYKNLGVCERWLNSFENFLEDMGERPKGFELHRKDNNKGYDPDNCEWKEKGKHVGDHNKERFL